MKDFLNRLKSPVVIAQIITIIGSLVCAITPELQGTIDKIVYSLTIIVNVFAGLNNPADKENF